MTPKKQAAMQEALADQHKPHEECECNTCLNYFTDKAHKEALAEQTEKSQLADASLEPVGWMEDSIEFYASDRPSNTFTIPLYTHPVRTKDLTDDKINELWLTHGQGQMMYIHEKFARAVIAADREKNK